MDCPFCPDINLEAGMNQAFGMAASGTPSVPRERPHDRSCARLSSRFWRLSSRYLMIDAPWRQPDVMLEASLHASELRTPMQGLQGQSIRTSGNADRIDQDILFASLPRCFHHISCRSSTDPAALLEQTVHQKDLFKHGMKFCVHFAAHPKGRQMHQNKESLDAGRAAQTDWCILFLSCS